MPLSGYHESSKEGIDKSKESAKDCLNLKFPEKKVTEKDFRFTCPLDLKYPIFTKKDKIVKTATLAEGEVTFRIIIVIFVNGFFTRWLFF